MAQYPIPQFIESEGKIIYFLTFRQFFLLILGGAICFALYFFLPFTLFIILAIIIICIIVGIAFLKIDNTPFLTFFFNYITFSTRAKNYTWRKKPSPQSTRLREPSRMRDSSRIRMADSMATPPSMPTPEAPAPTSPPSVQLKTGISNLNAAKKIIETKK